MGASQIFPTQFKLIVVPQLLDLHNMSHHKSDIHPSKKRGVLEVTLQADEITSGGSLWGKPQSKRAGGEIGSGNQTNPSVNSFARLCVPNLIFLADVIFAQSGILGGKYHVYV